MAVLGPWTAPPIGPRTPVRGPFDSRLSHQATYLLLDWKENQGYTLRVNAGRAIAILGLALLPLRVAADPFARVPPGEWPYRATQGLAAAGYFTGYPAETFRGGQSLTRYDFAVALQRMAEQVDARVSRLAAAMDDSPAEGDAAGPTPSLNPASVARELGDLRGLAEEFAPECATLGVDAGALQRRLDGLAERVARLTAPPAVAAPEPAAGNVQPGVIPARPATAPARSGRRFGLAARVPDLVRGGGLALPGAPVGPFQLSVQSAPAAALFPVSPLARLADGGAGRALDARLSLPVGRYLVSAFYRRSGAAPSGAAAWSTESRALQGWQSYGGGLTAPLGRRASLALEAGGLLRGAEGDGARGGTFVRSGLSWALGRQLTLGFGYERLHLDSSLPAAGVVEQYNAGVGHSFGPNANLQLFYQLSGTPRRGLDGNPAPVFDLGAGTAVTRFNVRF